MSSDRFTQQLCNYGIAVSRVNPALKEAPRKGEYKFIPLSPATVVTSIDFAVTAHQIHHRKKIESFQKQYKELFFQDGVPFGMPPIKFLEIGCGFGFVSAYAKSIGLDATGIDIDGRYLNWARRLYKHVNFKKADALKFEDYDKFDIIYFYQPFTEGPFRANFCKYLAERAKGIVIAVYGLYGTPFGCKCSGVVDCGHHFRVEPTFSGSFSLWSGYQQRLLTQQEVTRSKLAPGAGLHPRWY